MKVYTCIVCGYIYDPRFGDIQNGIKPNTPLEKIPPDWKCPQCKVGKNKFKPIW